MTVLAMHRAEFELAKQKERYSWIAEGFVAGAALVSLFIDMNLVVYTLAIVALVAAGLKWWFSRESDRHKNIAERGRRVVLLVSGLGYHISRKEITDLISSFSISEQDSDKWADPEYYQELSESSNRKLAGMLQESAFFSKHLYKLSARFMEWIFAIALFIALLGLFLLPWVANQTWSALIAQTVIIVLMFLLSVDILGRASAFSEAADLASKIDDRLDSLIDETVDIGDLVFIWEDYNAAVQDAPLIPTRVYDKHKPNLDKLYMQRTAEGTE